MFEWIRPDPEPADLTPPPDAPELRAFLAAIRERPDDPAPQLLLADWLDEHGDACARRSSELIRLRAALPDAPPERFQELHDRYAEIRAAHLPAWLRALREPRPAAGRKRPIRDRCEGWALALGRWTAYLSAAEFLHPEFATRLADLPASWLDTLDVRAAPTDLLLDLVVSPLLAELRQLGLAVPHDAGRGTRVVEALAGRSLPRLRELRLTASSLGPAGARTLAAAPLLAPLTALDLTDNVLGNDGTKELAGSPHLGRLERLVLAHNDLGPDGLQALLAASAAGVEHLALGRNLLGNRGARLLAATPLPRLRELLLPRNRLSSQGAKALADSPFLGGLERLELGNNPIGPEGRQALRDRFGDRVRF
jgi:uncharacterized protein (TIGR02996 family)